MIIAQDGEKYRACEIRHVGKMITCTTSYQGLRNELLGEYNSIDRAHEVYIDIIKHDKNDDYEMPLD